MDEDATSNLQCGCQGQLFAAVLATPCKRVLTCLVSNRAMKSQTPQAIQLQHNLRFLLRSRWLSQKDASDQIGVPYKWLRRLCHQGIERIDKRSKPNLEKLALFFSVEVGELWGDHIQIEVPANWVLIKWMGSKRRLAPEILRQFHRQIKTYWEPFVGSGAVLGQLLSSNIEVKRIRCSDACEPLIGIWNLIKDDPRKLSEGYRRLWPMLQSGEQRLYKEVRDRFNESGDPCDFFFLLRTCRVGAVEFSQAGKFITPYHLGEMGMEPKSVDALLADWHDKLKRRDVTFSVRDYSTVFSRDGDFLYLDPPYMSERSRLYLGRFDHDEFYGWLKKQRAGWALSMNGPADGDDSVPQIYDERFELQNGTSAVRRLGGLETPSVTESLFVRTACVTLQNSEE